MENLVGIFLLATLIEGLVNYLFGDKESRPWLKYVSLVLGIGATVAYRIDILSLAGLDSPVPFVGYVISGLIIGRGSNYLNDIIGKVRK